METSLPSHYAFLRDRNEALFGQFVAVLANIGVHPEHLVQNEDRRRRQDLRPRDIGAKLAISAFYGDAIVHCNSPQRMFTWAYADVVRIGGGPTLGEPFLAWRPHAWLTSP